MTESVPDRALDTWVVLPTYNESQNLPGISAAIRSALPGAHLLVVDDASPDGTGELADALATADPPVEVLHRAGKAGPRHGPTSTASRTSLHAAPRASSRWTPTGRIRPTTCPRSWPPSRRAPTSSSARATPRAAACATGACLRRLVSRGGSMFARVVLGSGPHDLTGGFKAWQRATLEAIDWERRALGRLRLPDRDDVPRLARRGPRRRGAHRLQGPRGGHQQDVEAHHHRGAARGSATALGRAARPWPGRPGPDGRSGPPAASGSPASGPPASGPPAAAGPTRAARPDDHPSG